MWGSCWSSSTAIKMASRSTQIMEQTWIATRRITNWFLIICLLQLSQGALLNETETLTVNPEAKFIYSECSSMSTQQMQYEKSRAQYEVSFDFFEIAKDIADIVREFEKQEIEIIDQSQVARFDCGLNALCINTFSLRALLKAKPKRDIGFIIDFVSVDSQQIMYMKSGQGKFIQKSSFKHFERSNIGIELKNISSHLIYVETANERKLLNSFSGKCYCKLCSTMKNLKLQQLAVKKTLKKVVYSVLELSVGLKIALQDDIRICLQEFLNDKHCMLNHTTKFKRSIFSSGDHDGLRRITKIFEKNFRNILLHEKARKFELNAMHRQISAEGIDLEEFRNFLRSSQVIEKLHKIQTDFYMLFNENFNILQEDLKTSDFIQIIELFKTKKCKFLGLLNACVFLINFRIDRNFVHANFGHNVYKLKNFTLFSCFVSEFEGTFWLNDLHNRVVEPKDIDLYNRSRPIKPSDYVLRNLKIIATRKIIDKRECYTLFCITNTTYFENNTLENCNRGSSKVFCGRFSVTFAEGTLSHLNLASHLSKAEWIGTFSEEFDNRIPSGLHEQNVQTYERDDNQLEMETEEASDWLLREDVVQIIGMALGTFFFILVTMAVLYLKCRKRGGSTLIVPSFKADTNSVTLHRGGFRQKNSYEQFSQPEPDGPTRPPASETTPNSADSAPPEVSHKRVKHKHTKQQSSGHNSIGSKRSLVADTFRTK